MKNSEITKQYMFNISDSPITLGRNNSNTIVINNSFLSKRQGEVYYDTTHSIWRIRDGFEGKKSTHGTWYKYSKLKK